MGLINNNHDMVLTLPIKGAKIIFNNRLYI